MLKLSEMLEVCSSSSLFLKKKKKKRARFRVTSRFFNLSFTHYPKPKEIFEF